MSGRYVLAVSLDPLDATTVLFFGHLAERMAGALRVVRYGQPDLAGHVAGASAVILVRALFEMTPVVWAARAFAIPVYYFLDDNFMVLREQRGPWSPFVERYSVPNVRDRLRAFTGVMLSSRILMQYFEQHRLHSRLLFFPPVAWPQPIRPTSRTGTGVGFFGGSHLHDTFRDSVLPAVRRLAVEQPVRLIVAGVTAAIPASPGLSVAVQPYDRSYANGLRTLAEAGVDVLVHPSVASLANNEYKNPHALISADAIGAVPVVSARPPYDHLGDEDVVLQCDDTVESWHSALALACQPATRRRIGERLAAFCAANFSGTVNRQVIDEMIAARPAPAAGVALWRRAGVRCAFLVDHLRRATRGVR